MEDRHGILVERTVVTARVTSIKGRHVLASSTMVVFGHQVVNGERVLCGEDGKTGAVNVVSGLEV